MNTSKANQERPPTMKVVSFSLYGENPKYKVGMMLNIGLIARFIPGWIPVVFCDTSVSIECALSLAEAGAEVWPIPYASLREIPNGLFWRFMVSDLTPGTRFIVRDADSRISEREVAAIDEWEKSGMPFHSMRDHPVHHHPMQGGMWGGIAGVLPNMAAAIINWDKHRPLKTGRHDLDQVFLNEVIWPQIKVDCLQHDSFFRHVYPESIPFPTPRVGQRFVGEVFDENDKPREGDYQQIPLRCTACGEKTSSEYCLTCSGIEEES